MVDAQVAFDFLFDDGTVSQSPADGENDGQDGDGGQYGGVGQGRSVAVQMLGQVAVSTNLRRALNAYFLTGENFSSLMNHILCVKKNSS